MSDRYARVCKFWTLGGLDVESCCARCVEELERTGVENK